MQWCNAWVFSTTESSHHKSLRKFAGCCVCLVIYVSSHQNCGYVRLDSDSASPHVSHLLFASIPHGQLWLASWKNLDYQWMLHNKIHSMIVVHDPADAEDTLPDFIEQLQNSPKHQILVCPAKDSDSPEAWKLLVAHFGACTRLITSSLKAEMNAVICCRQGTSCTPAVMCGCVHCGCACLCC